MHVKVICKNKQVQNIEIEDIVSRALTVQDIKKYIGKRCKLSTDQLKLISHGKLLSNEYTVDPNEANSILVYETVNTHRTIKVNVRTPDSTGFGIEFLVSTDEKVSRLRKLIIERVQPIPNGTETKFNLVYNSIILEDERTFFDYGITSDCSIFIIPAETKVILELPNGKKQQMDVSSTVNEQLYNDFVEKLSIQEQTPKATPISPKRKLESQDTSFSGFKKGFLTPTKKSKSDSNANDKNPNTNDTANNNNNNNNNNNITTPNNNSTIYPRRLFHCSS